MKKFNLEKFKSSTFNKSGKNKDKNENNNFPNELIENTNDVGDSPIETKNSDNFWSQ